MLRQGRMGVTMAITNTLYMDNHGYNPGYNAGYNQTYNQPRFGYNRFITRQRDLRLSNDNLARPALTVPLTAKPPTVNCYFRNFAFGRAELEFVSCLQTACAKRSQVQK